jgi:hypothetical protein
LPIFEVKSSEGLIISVCYSFILKLLKINGNVQAGPLNQEARLSQLQ